MKNKILVTIFTVAMVGAVLAGCGKESKEEILVDPDIQISEEAATEEATKADTELDPEFSIDEEMMVIPEAISIPGYEVKNESTEDGVVTQIYEDEDGDSIALYSAEDLSSQVFASQGTYWQTGFIDNVEYMMTTDENQVVYSVEWTEEDGTQRRLSAPNGMSFEKAIQMLYETIGQSETSGEGTTTEIVVD